MVLPLWLITLALTRAVIFTGLTGLGLIAFTSARLKEAGDSNLPVSNFIFPSSIDAVFPSRAVSS